MSMVGVSFMQPGPWSVLCAGCRVLNLPERETPPKHRGEVLLHASLACPHDDFDDANRRMLRAGVLPSGVLLPWRADLPRGGFVARATLVDVVRVDHHGHTWSCGHRPGPVVCAWCGVYMPVGECPKASPWAARHENAVGGASVVLADVTPLPAFVPAPAPSTHGLAFHVDGDVFARALALAEQATTDADLAKVAEVWRTAKRPTRGPRSRRAAVGGVEPRA
jgi:hypothetical protein